MASNTCIAMIGYRATGKTTVAQCLAGRLGWGWVDSDVEIEAETGKSIDRIFADEGESGFRDVESLVVAELCRRPRTIVALGGGAVLRQRNRQAIAECRAAVWLIASVNAIHSRMAADPSTRYRRPNLTNWGGRREIETLLAEREPIYRACATLEVDTQHKAPAEIADEIAAALGLAD
jgi:shikimate kinase